MISGAVVKNPPANTRGARDMSSIFGSGRSPGEGKGNPLQYSCLGNPTDRGAQWATVHGVAKSQTQLSNQTHTHTHLHTHTYTQDYFKSCINVQFSSVAQSCPTLRPHESRNSHPSSRWCHPMSNFIKYFSKSINMTTWFLFSFLLMYQIITMIF